MTYNGWTNHETWAVNLHLSNDYDIYTWLNKLAENTWRESVDWDEPGQYWTDRLSMYRVTLADKFKAFVEDEDNFGLDLIGLVDGSAPRQLLALDLLRGALGEVNWQEIAEGWTDDPMETWGE